MVYEATKAKNHSTIVNECLDSSGSPSKGMTGRKQKLAGARVKTVVKGKYRKREEEREKRRVEDRTHKTEGGHMQTWP